ncbi:SPOR domain-containing protein [Ekhidna sp. MALMAid0563]
MMELESDSIETTQEVITEPYAPLTGHIKAELDSIAKVAYEQNKDGQYVDGFVIQVYSGNSRQDANDARYKMNEYFPELSSKVSYHQPNFRVKAGKFTNRLRAHRVYADVKEEFPRALLIPERFFLRYE